MDEAVIQAQTLRDQSFALVYTDPDAPGGMWHHWAIYDIPAATRALAEHWLPTTQVPAPPDLRLPPLRL
jgi:hypothetical protein